METSKLFFRYIFLLSCVTVCLNDVTIDVATTNESEPLLQSRERRYLIFPDPSNFEMIMGFGLPIVVQEQSLTMGIIIKFMYYVPVNATTYTDYLFRRERRSTPRTSRWDMYTMLENTCDRLGMDGRACVLRAICEAADVTLKYNGLAGEVLHVLLTPSTTTEAQRSYVDSEYHAAEKLGREIPGCCHLLYPECKVPILDFISKTEFLYE